MFWNKKEDKPKKPKFQLRTKRLVYKLEEREIGKTFVELVSTKGEKFTTAIIGNGMQNVWSGNDQDVYNEKCQEPYVFDFVVTDSKTSAENFLKGISDIQTIWHDDPEHPTKIITNFIVKTAKIKNTVPYKTKFNVAYVEDIKNAKT